MDIIILRGANLQNCNTNHRNRVSVQIKITKLFHAWTLRDNVKE